MFALSTGTSPADLLVLESAAAEAVAAAIVRSVRARSGASPGSREMGIDDTHDGDRAAGGSRMILEIALLRSARGRRRPFRPRSRRRRRSSPRCRATSGTTCTARSNRRALRAARAVADSGRPHDRISPGPSVPGVAPSLAPLLRSRAHRRAFFRRRAGAAVGRRPVGGLARGGRACYPTSGRYPVRNRTVRSGVPPLVRSSSETVRYSRGQWNGGIHRCSSPLTSETR